MNILITGAGGFVGRNLSEYLTKKNYNVFAAKHTDLELLDAPAVKKYIEDNRINIIIHCAATGGSRKTNYDKENIDVVEKNLRMFFNIQRCLTPEMRMIHLGSGAEYDRLHWQHKMNEDYFDRHVPSDSYGYAKYLISKYIELNNNIICLRIFGLFGKYEDYRFKFISNSIIKNLLKMPITINQNVLFDYLYIDDFLKIVEYFINTKNINWRHYNITPVNSIDLLSIAKLVNNTGNYNSDIIILNKGMNREYTGNNSRLLSEIKNFSYTNYEDAISSLFEYYESILDTIDIETIKNDPYLKNCKIKKI